MALPVMEGDGSDDALTPVSDINVTPFVDVMMVLLVIFIITAPLMMSQLPLTLPKAALSEMGKPPDPVIVSLDVEGNYYINSTQVPYEDFVQRLHQMSEQSPDNTVYVRADKAIPYGKVVNLLKLVGASGFYKVSLVSRDE